MKKAFILSAIVLCFLLVLSSCNALMAEIMQDGDTTVNETERDPFVTTDETDEATEEPTEAPITTTEGVTEYPTEVPTETPTETLIEAPTEETTEPIPDETLPPLFSLEENGPQFLLVVELEGADGCDMRQLTFREAHKDGSTYRFTATLNHRAYQAGDIIEIEFRDLVYHGEAIDVQEAVESGLLKVSLSPFGEVGPADKNAFTWREDGRAVFTVTQELIPPPSRGGYVFNITVYIGEEVCIFSAIITY